MMCCGSVKTECFVHFRGWLLNLGGGSSVSPSLRAGLVFGGAGPAFLRVVWAGQVALVCSFLGTVIGLIICSFHCLRRKVQLSADVFRDFRKYNGVIHEF